MNTRKLKRYASKLKEYCILTNCLDCIFYKHDSVCDCKIRDPFLWNEPKNEKENNTNMEIDKTRQIAIIWSVEDVQEVRPDLDDTKAFEVLQMIKKGHDANIGVSWEELKICAAMMYPLEGDCK